MRTLEVIGKGCGLLLASLTLWGCSSGGDGMGTPPGQSPQDGDTFAVTSSNRLVRINRSSGAASAGMMITGLQGGENIVGIDIRPANNMLYALTSSGRLYTIDTSTGVATFVSTLIADPSDTTSPYTGLDGTDFGVDFNPVVDRLRVVSNTGQNLRINVDDGTTFTDGLLTVGGLPRSGIGAVAYTSNFSSACNTVVSFIDVTTDKVLTSANTSSGVMTEVGNLGIDASGVSGYEIVSPSSGPDVAVAALTVGSTTSLYTVNLSSGAVTPSGTISGLNSGETIVGLTISPPANPPTQSLGNMLGLTETNRVVSFNAGAPQKLCTMASVSGLQNGESILGIDVRPADGKLYAVGSSGRIYTVDPMTGAATQVSVMFADPSDTTNPYAGFEGTDFGVEFNPVADQLRVISNTGQNLRIIVATGATFTDTPMNPAGSAIMALAYTNGFAGAGSLSAYVLDVNGDRLMTLGAQSGSAVNGDLAPVGPLGIGDIGPIASLEINGVNNMAFAAVNINGATTSDLHTINLMTGDATRVGTIGGSERVRGIALTAVPQATVFGATDDNRLIAFNPATPATLTTNVAITGIQGGESIVGLDFRPAIGLLYALTDAGRVYTISTTTGAAQLISMFNADPTDMSMPYMGLMGTAFGFDFNPVVDRLRTFSDVEENLRSNPDDGTTFTDGTLKAGPFAVTAAAYTNNFDGATVTTLYVIDTVSDVLLIQNPSNSGTLFPVGPLAVGDVQAVAGFEIVGPTTAFAALSTAARPAGFYSIDLTTGAATLVGNIALASPSDRVTGISAPPSVTAPAANSPVFGIVNGRSLITFPRNAPGNATVAVPITNLQGGEVIVGADFRPATGVLYALTNAGRLYTIDTGTAAATLVAPISGATLSGTNFGVDFSPVADALRVISDTGQNLAINITNGAATVATNLNFMPDIVAVGYTSNYVGAPSTRALVLDSATSSLFTVNPTVDGLLFPVGRLSPTLTFSSNAAFDIAGGDDGLVLAALQPTGAQGSSLYRVNPRTGAATLVDTIGPNGTTLVRALAIRLQ